MARKKKAPTEIVFDFIKSNYFRVVRADGVFGGLAPSGAIHMGVYSERSAIPKQIVHSIVEGGQLGPELKDKRVVRSAIVREVEVDVVLDIAQAMTLRQWLDDKVEQYQKLVGPLPQVPAPQPVKGESVPAKGGNGKEKP